MHLRQNPQGRMIKATRKQRLDAARFFLEMGNFAGTSKLLVRSGQVQGSKLMNGLIYLVGLVVVILAVLSFFGLR